MKSRHPRLRTAVLNCFLGASVSLFLISPVQAQTLADAPQNALRNRAFLDGVSGWELLQGSTRSSMETVALPPDEAAGVGRALHLEVKSPVGAANYTVQLRQEIGSALTQGQQLRLSFWARSPQSAAINAVVEDKTTYAKVLEEAVALAPTWKRYEFTVTVPTAFAANATTVNFQFGGVTAVTELADIRVEDPASPLPNDGKLEPTERGSLQKPLSLLRGNADFATDWTTTGAGATRFNATIDGETVPAVKLDIAEKSANAWNVKIATTNPKPLVGGDTIAVRAWARSSTENTVSFIFQKSSGNYQKFVNQSAKLTPGWKEYRFVGQLDGAAGLVGGGSNFEVQLGASKGTVELARVRVDSYGDATPAAVLKLVGGETVDYYGGRENSDEWRAPALARIEQLRKAPLQVRVINSKGKPVLDAQIQVNMTRPSFRWGTAAPASLMADHTDADAVRYQQILQRYFNTVTFENDLKWQDTSPQAQQTIDNALAWLRANDIEVRGHNLVWGSFKFLPKNIDGKPAAELTDDEWKTAIAQRIANQGARYRGQVYAWDVVNEAVSEHDLWDKIGWDNFVNTFRQAQQSDTNALLSYNDYFAINRMGETPQWTREREIIKMLIDADVPLDTIGEQAHLGTPLIPMTQILKNLDDIAALGKPIEITEFDLSLLNDQVNGEYVRDFLIAAYSHPKVESIIQWGFWQGAHWRGNEGAALYTRDWKPRPAALAYEDLVLNQWWTREKGVTNKAGEFAVRGFLGDYSVTATRGGKTATAQYKLSKGAPDLVLTLD